MSDLSVISALTQEIDDLNQQAWAINRKDAVKSIELANEALSKSIKADYVKGMALAKKTLGACHVWLAKNETAANYCFEAIALFQGINDIANEAETNYYLGANFFYLSDYDSAIKYYKNSYDISARINHEPGMADGLNGMGTVYYTIEQNDKALEVLTESQELCVKNDVKTVLVKVKDGLGETYYNLKQYNEALKYYYECIELTTQLTGFQQVQAFALDGLGRTYTGLGNFEKAIECYEETLKLRKELGFKFGVATTLTNMGKLYIQCDDTKNALKCLKEAYDLSIEIGSKEGVYQSSEKLAELYEKTGKNDKALEYYKIFHQAKEDVRNHKSAQLSKSLELQNKVLQSQAEKAILEERAKELENFSESLTLMSEIGQQIISSLSVETIVNTVYKNVNALMDATGFGIGLYREEDDTVVFPVYIEGEERFENIRYELTDNNRLTVLCYNQSREIVINDFHSEIGKYIEYTAPKAGKNVESIIYLPLIYNNRKLGVITVQSFSKNAYSNYHLNIFKNLATYTAIALENAKLYAEQELKVKERTRELLVSKEEIERSYETNKKINDIGRQITSNLNLGKIFKQLYNRINEIMSVECFGVRIYKPEINAVEYKFEMEKGEVYEEVMTIPLTDDDNYTVWCIKNKKDIFLNDNRKEYSKYVKQIKVVSGDMPNSLMFTPMMIGEKLIGVITVQSFQYNAYTPNHLEILKTLATYTATALENAYLYEYMEDKVKERTKEVVIQKEQIEKTFENTRLVSEIGKEITSTFSIKEIINKVYHSVNKLMDATMFGIGIFDPVNGRINFSGVIENGKHLDDYFYTLQNTERPAVWCFTNQQDYIINSFTEEFVKSKKITDIKILQGDATESIIYVPVTQGQKTIGVLTVQSYLPNAYNDYHLQLIKSLAVYTAIAIDNASLYNNLEVRVEERTAEIEKNYRDTQLIGEISKELSASLSVETIIDSVHKNIHSLMNADAFGIALYNRDNNCLEFKGFVENGKRLDDFTVDVTKNADRLGAICFNSKNEIIINDLSLEYAKYFKGEFKPIQGNDNHSIVYLPIFSKDEVIGIITVQSLKKNAYSHYQVNILKNLGVSIGIALDNASLYQNLEEKVNERTQEVVKQKEQIEKTFENTRLVSEIGKEISSTFSIQDIISKVYNSINKLMDATMFGIGIYDAAQEKITFKGAIEEGEMLDEYYYALSEKGRPAVLCFTEQKDIVIHNFTEEFIKSNKVKNRHSLPGRNTESIIYIPLTQQDKKIGVITVQSYEANVYNDYHLQLLKNLALYTAIALDNASLYTNMEVRVIERTDEIQQAYENTRLLSQIAEDISSSLSVETINSKVYENVNKLMDATMFGIGLHNREKNTLEFKGFMENNQMMEDFEYKADDPNRLAAYCFTNEMEIHINDYSKEYVKYIKGMQAPVSGKDSTSIAYIPLYAKGNIIGVFTVQSFTKDAYSEYQFNILKSLAVSIGIALDNANLYQNLEEKVKERTLEVIKQKEEIERSYENTRILSKIGNDITATLSIEDIIDKVYANVNNLMDATGFGVGVYNKNTNKIIFPLYIEGDEKFSSITYDISEKDRLTNVCYSKGMDIVINDFRKEIAQYVGYVQAPLHGKEVQSIIYLPLRLKENVIGVITVQSFSKDAYTDYHVQILRNLAVYVAIAIDNASLYQNMEEMVQERTAEVVKQKELLEKNFNDVKLSAEIAKVIASSLSVETIVSQVYENVKSILNAESFGIGLYNPENNTIGFSGFIEKGKKLPFVEVSLDDNERYAVMCFNKDMEVIINDHQKDYIKYTKEFKKSIVGEVPESLIYLPLYTKDKKIGVVTAQCFTKNAFQDFHVNILKNLGVSIAIALDNASLYQNLEEKVKERTQEVIKQKAIIEEKNKDITDSIRYAKKIQQAIAPNIDEFNRNFGDSFILYKPKDIVSGDFYWFEHFNETTVFAAADCTGHGVPGAFMSLICSDIMYKVINDQKIHDPAKALASIDKRLVQLIKKSSEASANDGMDIALCTYIKKEKKLLYAGAHRPILVVRAGEIIEYRPNKFSIGGHTTDGKHFDLTEIFLQPGDSVYLLTDGYADQFGGDNGKKFKFKNFKDLVLSIAVEPMVDQKRILDETFEAWRGSLEQIDDVCVIGIKI